ncbi:hypothetical protein ACLI4Y_07305 [Natrialbaceae archaeon A-CW3]
MRSIILVIAAVLALTLAVPTAAISLEPTDTTDSLILEASSQYATIEDGELRVDFDRLNADSVTTVDEVFTVEATDDEITGIILEAESEGVEFYQSDDPAATIDPDTPMALETDESRAVGMSIDSRTAEKGTSTFTISVVTEDDSGAGGPPGFPAPSPQPPDDGGEDDPAYTLEGVDLSATDVTAGETITVTGTYQGGDQPVTTTAGLTVDGIVVSQRTVTIPADSTETVAFERTMETPGTYEVGIGDQTETVTVTEPTDPTEPMANITVTNATLEQTQLRPGERGAVVLTVTNTGDVAGERTLEFAVGGFVADRTTVDLEPGETREVRFEQRFERVGTYALAVNGVDVGTVTVVEEGTIAATITDLPNEAAPALAVPLALGAGLAVHWRRS